MMHGFTRFQIAIDTVVESLDAPRLRDTITTVFADALTKAVSDIRSIREYSLPRNVWASATTPEFLRGIEIAEEELAPKSGDARRGYWGMGGSILQFHDDIRVCSDSYSLCLATKIKAEDAHRGPSRDYEACDDAWDITLTRYAMDTHRLYGIKPVRAFSSKSADVSLRGIVERNLGVSFRL